MEGGEGGVGGRSKKETRRSTPIVRLVTFWWRRVVSRI